MPKPRTSRHKQREVLTEQPVLSPGQTVVRVTQACGENIYEVEDSEGHEALYRLPKRLRHIAFIKRGCFVFVRDDPTRGPGKVKGEIEVVVLDHFLSSLRNEPFWPTAFAKHTNQKTMAATVQTEREASIEALANDREEQDGNDDQNRGEVDDDDDDDENWEIGAGNPNRQNWSREDDGEESQSSDDG